VRFRHVIIEFDGLVTYIALYTFARIRTNVLSNAFDYYTSFEMQARPEPIVFRYRRKDLNGWRTLPCVKPRKEIRNLYRCADALYDCPTTTTSPPRSQWFPRRRRATFRGSRIAGNLDEFVFRRRFGFYRPNVRGFAMYARRRTAEVDRLGTRTNTGTPRFVVVRIARIVGTRFENTNGAFRRLVVIRTTIVYR